jgi:hypothetical protein
MTNLNLRAQIHRHKHRATMIPDAIIRDVVSCIPEEQRLDVLLYALQKLPLERSVFQCSRCVTLVTTIQHLMHECPHSTPHTVAENAVQSCLQVATNVVDIAKAHVIRAKVRLAAGAKLSAQEGACSHVASMYAVRELMIEQICRLR